jgi:TonB family protein
MGFVAGLAAALLLQGGSGAETFATGGRQPGDAPVTTGDVTLRAIGGNFDQAPQWIRELEPMEVGAVYPVQAMRTGRDGSAELNCTLTVDGALRGCSVVRETAGDFGFGAAAVALTQRMNIRPAMRAGQPVATQVAINVTYQGPGVPTGSFIRGATNLTGMQRVVNNVQWERAPSYDQVVAAYPDQARAANQGGRVSLFCTFDVDGGFISPCTVENEEPVGMGFADAANRLAASFRAPTSLADGTELAGAGVQLPFTFSARMLQPNTTAAGAPAVLALPTNEEIGQAFPGRARQEGVGESEVMLDCFIGAGGLLRNCEVASESPEGYGFGEAALELAPSFRMSQWSPEGLPVVGSRVRIPVSYDLNVQAQASAD